MLLDLALLRRIDGDAARHLIRQNAMHLRHIDAVERLVERIDEILPQIGDEAAERVGQPRTRRDQHLGDAEIGGECHRMQRPGAAEGE